MDVIAHSVSKQHKVNSMWEKYSFGYDVCNIQAVMVYVKEYYDADDYRFTIGYGDDTINGLEIVNVGTDDELEELINACDGKGNYEE